MNKLLLCVSTALLAMFVGCSDDIADDVIGEIEDAYGDVLLNGKNIAGVWAVVEEELDSEVFDYQIKELCIIDSETINYHYSVPSNGYGENGYGFRDGFLYDCTLENYKLDSSALFSLIGSKVYVAGFYVCELEWQEETLTFIYANSTLTLKKVKGFKKLDLPSSGKTDEIGLPIPLANEIYYRTSDGEPIEVSFSDCYYHIYDKEKNYGRIVSSEAITSIRGFRGCDRLIHINLPNSATSIGVRAFSGCSSLASITIPDSVTSIGEDAFSGCTSLKSTTIGNGVTSIGDWAFEGCTSLTSVIIGDNVTSIGEEAFSGCTSLTSVIIGDNVTSIGEGAFDGCSSLASITIPDSVTAIGDWTFYKCISLTSVIIGDNVTAIGEGVFCYCSSLASITIPDSVTSIGYVAFGECSSLVRVTIPDSVTSIGEDAFCECSSLVRVTIPDSVTSIGGGAFYGCSSLAEVYCKPTTPPTGATNMFYYYNGWNWQIGCKIYVPTESVDEYKSAEHWSEYADDIVGYDFE